MQYFSHVLHMYACNMYMVSCSDDKYKMFVQEYHPGNFTHLLCMYMYIACSVIVCCVYSCIKDDWKAEKVGATGVDFNELEDAFREKVCTMYMYITCTYTHLHVHVHVLCFDF